MRSTSRTIPFINCPGIRAPSPRRPKSATGPTPAALSPDGRTLADLGHGRRHGQPAGLGKFAGTNPRPRRQPAERAGLGQAMGGLFVANAGSNSVSILHRGGAVTETVKTSLDPRPTPSARPRMPWPSRRMANASMSPMATTTTWPSWIRPFPNGPVCWDLFRPAGIPPRWPSRPMAGRSTSGRARACLSGPTTSRNDALDAHPACFGADL